MTKLYHRICKLMRGRTVEGPTPDELAATRAAMFLSVGHTVDGRGIVRTNANPNTPNKRGALDGIKFATVVEAFRKNPEVGDAAKALESRR